MSKPPWFRSSAARAWVMTGTLLLVLIGSLGLAQWVSSLRAPLGLSESPVQVSPELSVRIPQGWTPIDGPATPPGAILRFLGAFQAPDGVQSLTLWRLTARPAMRPQDALQEAMTLIPAAGRPQTLVLIPGQPAIRFREGSLLGMHHVVLSAVDQPRDLLMTAVVTETGRDYWALQWRGAGLGVHSKLPLIPHYRQAFEQVCRTVRLHSLRPATESDLTEAAIPDIWVQLLSAEGWRAMVPAEHQPGQAVTLLPRMDVEHVHTLRLLGAADLTSVDQNHDLWPGTLMENDFYHHMGRGPGNGEIARSAYGSIEVWHTRFPASRTGMIRRLWYLRLPQGRSLLMESLSDAQDARFTDRQVVKVIEQVAGLMEGDSPAASAAELDLERARTLAGRLMRSFSQEPSNPWQYHLYQVAGQAVGCQVSGDLPVAAAAELPRGGWSRTWIWLGEAHQTHLQWHSTADGSRFVMELLPQAHASTGVPPPMRIERVEQRLAILARQGDQPWKLWRMINLPAGYISPMTMDRWPLEMLGDLQEEPVVVWLAASVILPRACQVQLKYDDRGRAELWLRPLLALDADRLILDDQGRIERRIIQQSYLEPTGGFTLTVNRVSPEQLLQALPQMSGPLQTLSQEIPSHE